MTDYSFLFTCSSHANVNSCNQMNIPNPTKISQLSQLRWQPLENSRPPINLRPHWEPMVALIEQRFIGGSSQKQISDL